MKNIYFNLSYVNVKLLEHSTFPGVVRFFRETPTGPGTDKSLPIVSTKLRVVPRCSIKGIHSYGLPGRISLERFLVHVVDALTLAVEYTPRMPSHGSAHVYSIRTCTHPIKGKQRSPPSV